MMGMCGSSRKDPIELQNVMSDEEFKAKTDNYDKIMKRTWYCIANNMGGSPHAMEVMWELNTWNTADRALGTYCFTNHTVTRPYGATKIDADPLWPGNIVDGKAGMTPVLPLPCFNMTMSPVEYQNLCFPNNDSFKEFWTYEMPMMGMRPCFIFALTPHISDDLYEAHLATLKVAPHPHSLPSAQPALRTACPPPLTSTDPLLVSAGQPRLHGRDDWQDCQGEPDLASPPMLVRACSSAQLLSRSASPRQIRWPADYKPGDCGEESENHEGNMLGGGGATLVPEYKAKVNLKA